MLESAIYLVTIIQIVMLYWLTANKMLRLIDDMFLSKNRPWLEQNPAFTAQCRDARLASLLLHVLGAGWLVLAVRAAASSADMPVYLAFAPTLAWLALVLLYCAVAYLRIGRKIPLPAKRSVPFERRTLRDFVPPVWTGTCFILYIAAMAAYAIGFGRGDIAADVFIGRMAGFSIILVTGSATLLYCVRRKQQPIDEAWGPSYRRMEVRGSVAVLYLCLLVVGWCMLHDFFALSMSSQVTFFTLVNLVMQVVWLRFFSSPVIKRMLVRG